MFNIIAKQNNGKGGYIDKHNQRRSILNESHISLYISLDLQTPRHTPVITEGRDINSLLGKLARLGLARHKSHAISSYSEHFRL